MASLCLESVSKRFGGIEAVAGLSLAVEPGRFTGLIGPNGAGKTTVVNLISGLMTPSGGRIRLGERDLTGEAPHQIARLGVSRTFQTVRLLREASVLDNIVVGSHRHERSSLFANSIGLPVIWRERRSFRDSARALLARFELTELAEVPAGGLSYGHQRLVEIMRALAMKPDFLLLDEPVAGMNEVEARRLGVLLRSLVKEGIGMLLIEHNMRFVMEFCETIYVVDSGRLIAEGSADAVSRDATVIRAYLGG
ncbi:MAG TPA: ABC transporter ATP-binding protein [Stellaceae bacterium]|jgi:branched-chain amino acid transport system ATP-binding protein|nr:ABC transporter ATP-binding protein [Stellaceae bacterium]